MSGARRPLGRATALTLTAIVVATLSLAGCGKYGKPVRERPEPRKLALGRAEPAETRYTLSVASVAGNALPSSAAVPPKAKRHASAAARR